VDALLVGVLSLVGGWGGAYLGAYVRKKGENLATHEDIGKLVDQVRAVTQTTKEIEAKISSDVWNQQKQWEMKREVLFGAAKSIVELDDLLIELDSLLRMDDPDGDQWLKARHKATMGWNDALKRFIETKLLVEIVCSRETSAEFGNLGVFVSNLGAKLAKKDAQVYRESVKELAGILLRTRFAIRKELGVDGAALQSSS
jgi:hypothetical protein